MINRQKGTNKISQFSLVISLIPFMKVEPPKALFLYTNTMSVRDQPRNFVRTYTHGLQPIAEGTWYMLRILRIGIIPWIDYEESI